LIVISTWSSRVGGAPRSRSAWTRGHVLTFVVRRRPSGGHVMLQVHYRLW